MLQKRNDLELIELLRKEPTHVRALAVLLKLTPSTVLRTLQTLQAETVVDFKRVGRNCVYELKETPEARAYLIMSEQYKFLKLIQDPLLRSITTELREGTDGEVICIFGSHADGTETKTSDIDVYIESHDRALRERIQHISPKVSLQFGTLEPTSTIAKEIRRNHVIIQNVERFLRLSESIH